MELYNNNTKKIEKVNNDEEIIIKLFSNNYRLPFKEKSEKEIHKMRKYISKIQDLIPLYDIYHNNLFLVNKHEIYHFVFNKHYRLPNKQLYQIMKSGKTERDKNNVLFLDNYILDVLEKTYLYLLYHYSEQMGKNITTCSRPSFIPYLQSSTPYYTRSELINLALNLKLIKPSEKFYDIEDILKLCDQISSNDIKGETLMKHQEYIKDYKYLIKNFTFMSSSKYNRYLRNKENTDLILENTIGKIVNLINNAPAFDKDYYIYRFISDDFFLQDLKVGQIFVDKGFVSTTRNPFYNAYENVFGFILLKIKIPKNVKGVGICVETYSLFPNEQEIILALGSKLKLISKDKDFKYFHTNIMFQNLITKKYEFEWVGIEKVELNKELDISNIPEIKWDWNSNLNTDGYNLEEKITYFLNRYTYNNKFVLNYDNKKYMIWCDYYNSTDAYKNFFFIETKKGFCMNIQQQNGFFDMFMEIDNEGSVNFISRYMDNDLGKQIDDELLLQLIGIFSMIFKIQKIYIHPYYLSFKKINDRKDIASDNIYLCDDIYKYLMKGEKRFSKYINNGIENKFYYYQLEKLKKLSVKDFVSYTDDNDLYYIFNSNKISDNLLDFYLYLVSNNFTSVYDMEQQLSRKVFIKDNPFDGRNKYYIFYPFEYLYNNKFINYMPTIEEKEYEIKFNFPDTYEIPVTKIQRNQGN